VNFSRVITGVSVNKIWKAFNGFTLYTPLASKEPLLINMRGEVVHKWKMGYTPAVYGQLLDNGNLLYAGHDPKGPLADFEGAGGILLEVDFNGKEIWSYKNPYMHHGFCRLENGNTLVLKWEQLPDSIARNIPGGVVGSEKDGKMWGDCIAEIDKKGNTVWEWKSSENLKPADYPICPLCYRSHWLQACCCSVMSDGNILTTFRSCSVVCIINRQTGKVNWKWGFGEISHSSWARPLENGNILVFDNGIHGHGVHFPFSRIVEINPNNNQMVWGYRDKDNENTPFYGSFMSSCQRLPNGNTLIAEADNGRIFEVNTDGEIVWEFLNPVHDKFPNYGDGNAVPSVFRYDPALISAFADKHVAKINKYTNPKPMIDKQQKTPEKKQEMPSGVESRLSSLGY